MPDEPQSTILRPAPAGGGFNPASLRIGPLTGFLIAICVVVAFLSDFGKNAEVTLKLFISQYPFQSGEGVLPEVLRGEVWRLLTPAFVHQSLLHILFNMLWLKDLGGMIEKRVGTLNLLALVLGIDALANLGQYFFSGPYFGGMSGVVYGLFGYVWMKAKFDPASGIVLHPRNVQLMVGWFFICLTGAVGPVANYAHGVGLVSGVIWGLLSAKLRSPRAICK